MLFSGELGWLNEGPNCGELAPDFTLPAHDASTTVALSQSRGKKPVVLIFGSFT
jgi:peroxiredoxin